MIVARKNSNTYVRLPNLHKSKLIAIAKPSNNEKDTSVLHIHGDVTIALMKHTRGNFILQEVGAWDQCPFDHGV